MAVWFPGAAPVGLVRAGYWAAYSVADGAVDPAEAVAVVVEEDLVGLVGEVLVVVERAEVGKFAQILIRK